MRRPHASRPHLACPLLPLPAGGSIGASRRPPAAAGRARAVLPLPVLPPLPLLPGARGRRSHLAWCEAAAAGSLGACSGRAGPGPAEGPPPQVSGCGSARPAPGGTRTGRWAGKARAGRCQQVGGSAAGLRLFSRVPRGVRPAVPPGRAKFS